MKMPAASFLHIHRSGESAIRAIALTGDVVRVGRGPLCEISLDGDGVSPLQLILRRRGGHWSVQPIGATPTVRLDGEALREVTRLQPGAVLHVGEYRLAFVSVDPEGAAVEPGSFTRPITLGAIRPLPTSVGTEPVPEPRTCAPSEITHGVRTPPTPRTPTSTPASSWRASVDRASAWLAAQRQEVQRPTPRPFDAARVPEPRARIPAMPTRDVPKWTPPLERRDRAATPLPVDRERSAPPIPSRIALQNQRVMPPESGSGEWLDEEDRAARRAWESDEHPVGRTSPSVDFELPDDFESISRAAAGPNRSGSPEPIIRTASAPSESKASESRAWRIVEDAPPVEGDGPGVVVSDPPADFDEERERAEEHWPSVASILTRDKPTGMARDRSARRVRPEPSPTVVMGPRVVRLPLYVSVPILLASIFTAGAAAIYLGWLWADDARVAGPMTNFWTAGDVEAGAGRFAPIPKPTWWASTADALYLHAASLAATARDALDREDQKTMLDLAGQAAPTHPGVHFARHASTPRNARDAAPSTTPASRDVASLGRAAARELAGGRIAAGGERLSEAMSLAARLEPEEAEYPGVDRESNGLRLLLPQEDVVADVLRTCSEPAARARLSWDSVMPDHAGPWLALYRSRRIRSRTEAREILKRIAGLSESPTRGDHAWHRAARAEALAQAERWAEAAETYRSALELRPGPLLGSVIWFNLGDVLGRLGEPEAAREARRTSRRLTASLTDRPRDQARRLHETLEGDGSGRSAAAR
jgi:tetratricopeptide (TPR) repeat protein